jgi:hypothetical protein
VRSADVVATGVALAASGMFIVRWSQLCSGTGLPGSAPALASPAVAPGLCSEGGTRSTIGAVLPANGRSMVAGASSSPVLSAPPRWSAAACAAADPDDETAALASSLMSMGSDRDESVAATD